MGGVIASRSRSCTKLARHLDACSGRAHSLGGNRDLFEPPGAIARTVCAGALGFARHAGAPACGANRAEAVLAPSAPS